MNKTLVPLLVSAALIAACAKDETPDTAVDLPIRYAAIDLADVTTADSLTKRCGNEESLFREHFATLESYAGVPTIDSYTSHSTACTRA